jgi:quercetin dioxygenase-like cupin family protein/molybdopterin converting factor small subunit
VRVTVNYFGVIGDIAGAKSEVIELSEGATVAALIGEIAARHSGFAAIAKQVRAVINGQSAGRDALLGDGDEVGLMRAIAGGSETLRAASGRVIRHADLPIVPSPSGLPSQHIVTAENGSTSLFLGQQWLKPGDRVLLHTHPCEEAIMFLTGSGEVSIDGEISAVQAGASVFFAAGSVHGFRNTGDTEMHVIIVFPVPHFAPTTIVEA